MILSEHDRAAAGLPRHSASEQDRATAGVWHAALAYGLWGLVPIYWKSLQAIPALQLICHRIVWSCLLLVVMVALSRDRRALKLALRSQRSIGIYTAAALIIALNWLIYVWAVNAGFVLQTSLGYFINPLVNVLLGVLLFRERLRRAQWAAVGLAAAGVVYLTIIYGSVPWIALSLAVSFSTYALVKKVAPLGSIQGLALETAILFVPATAYLMVAERLGTGGFLHASVTTQLLLAAAGPVTTIPLLFFGSAARRIPLSLMGMLQYISPSLQFLLGVLVYKEAFSRVQFAGFGLVWAALVLFAAEGYLTRRWPALGVAEVP